ncbi:ABC transporter permease [Xylanimonas allomyrinae]|uniref:ABC transporter permease n=1 Tax=Xylanimonas allomyrinae TaxID=2509459 RepID=A0A4P6EQ08_9MICO|nr:methionine ABC transporter permease [Xylanimonas allomyrinae]QAY64586.1 ABC transporter permease [Xylanimonas allomyrinae]
MSWWEVLTTHRVIRQMLPEATVETLQMVGVAAGLTLLLGLPLGVMLYATASGGTSPNRPVNAVVGLVANVVRSMPFLILMIALLPLTRWVVGTTLQWEAAVVPLTVGAVPFYARLVETALRDIPVGKVEAAQVMGASQASVTVHVLLREALPALVSSFTVTVIALLGYSAMAGVIGAGGLGALAISYGYQRFDNVVMAACVVVLAVLVVAVQALGDAVARVVDHR